MSHLSSWPFLVKRLESKPLKVEMFDPRPMVRHGTGALPGFSDPRTMSDAALRSEWFREASKMSQEGNTTAADQLMGKRFKGTIERTGSPAQPTLRKVEELSACGAGTAGSVSLIDSPTHGAAVEGLSGACGGPKDRDVGHVPSTRAQDGAAKAATAGRGLVRTAIVEVEGVRLLLDQFSYEPGYDGDFTDPPYQASVSFTSVYVMRGGEVFKVDLMPIFNEEILDKIEQAALKDYGA